MHQVDVVVVPVDSDLDGLVALRRRVAMLEFQKLARVRLPSGDGWSSVGQLDVEGKRPASLEAGAAGVSHDGDTVRRPRVDVATQNAQPAGGGFSGVKRFANTNPSPATGTGTARRLVELLTWPVLGSKAGN